MSRYRNVHVRMWRSPDFRALERPKPSARELWFFLLTAPQTEAIPGLFSCGPASMGEEIDGGAERPQWTGEVVRKKLAIIVGRGMARVDWSAPLIYLPAAMRHNPPQNANVVVAWRKAFAELPRCSLLDVAHADTVAFLEELGEGFGKAFAEGFTRRQHNQRAKPLPKGSATQDQEQDQEQKQEQDARAGGVGDAIEAPPAYPLWSLDWLRAEWMGALNEATGTLWPAVPPFPEESVALESIGALAQQHECPPEDFRKRLMENILVWKADNRGYVSERPTRYVAWMARERVKAEQAAEAIRTDGKVGVLPGLRRGAAS